MRATRLILVVEDDPLDVELIERAFGRLALTPRLRIVPDGQAALDLLFGRGAHASREMQAPAAVIVDLKMPRVGGLEVLRAVRADARLGTTPTVVLSASAEESDIRASYAAGASAYVVKPMSLSEFTAALESLGRFWGMVNEPPAAGDRSWERETDRCPSA